MNNTQDWSSVPDLVPQTVYSVVDPRTLLAPSGSHQTVGRSTGLGDPNSNSPTYMLGSGLEHANNFETSEDIKSQTSPIPEAERTGWDMLYDPQFVDGGTYGAYKEEDKIDAGLELELDVGDEGREEFGEDGDEEEGDEEDGDEEEAGEKGEDRQNSDAKDTNNAMPESEQQPEGSQNSKSPPSKRPSGNNPYGSRGCFSCMACRRRKGKVFQCFLQF